MSGTVSPGPVPEIADPGVDAQSVQVPAAASAAGLSAPAAGRGSRPNLAWRIGARLLGALAVLFAVVTLTYFALKLVPGDPVLAILGGGGAAPSDATVAAVRAQYGLDLPVYQQYLNYLSGVFRGDLGTSYIFKRPVLEYLGPQIWPTLQLTLASVALAWLISLALTLLTVRRGRVADAIGNAVEVLFAAIPPFWIGIILLVVFSFTLGWFPVAGNADLRALVLPALALAIPLAGFLAQVTRSSFAEALDQPFVLSARARGASTTGVRIRHALRHALLPGLELSGWAVGSLISGAVVAEVIFSRQGLGRALVDAIVARDTPVVLAVVVFIALVYVVVNILVEILVRVVDPRLIRKRAAA
ncbi:ABC transporter permease [Mycetocola saprophilus]|uniref:ABC transporter permease n=1 Tax=Mycetocola saprophilus TaxID=76636 RepID=UPI003BF34542